jgi:hypothetical protein
MRQANICEIGTPMAISHDTATHLSHELVRLMKLFQSLRQHAPRLHPGVDTASYPILFNLQDGPRRVSDLAGCVHSDVSTVSRQVSGLVTHALVEKVPDPRGEWFRSVLADWSEDEATAFTHSLERLVTDFDASRDRLQQMAAATQTAGPTPETSPAPSPSKEQ